MLDNNKCFQIKRKVPSCLSFSDLNSKRPRSFLLILFFSSSHHPFLLNVSLRLKLACRGLECHLRSVRPRKARECKKIRAKDQKSGTSEEKEEPHLPFFSFFPSLSFFPSFISFPSSQELFILPPRSLTSCITSHSIPF